MISRTILKSPLDLSTLLICFSKSEKNSKKTSKKQIKTKSTKTLIMHQTWSKKPLITSLKRREWKILIRTSSSTKSSKKQKRIMTKTSKISRARIV